MVKIRWVFPHRYSLEILKVIFMANFFTNKTIQKSNFYILDKFRVWMIMFHKALEYHFFFSLKYI